jgi:hypothetical protein
VLRIVFLLVIVACCVPLLSAAGTGGDGFKDAAFNQLPFDQWVAHGEQTHLRWTTSLSDVSLSTHQRLSARVYIQVDGNELAKRRGKGTLLVLVQLTDEQGRAWQNHQEMDLEHVEEGIKASDAIFSQLFFILPGDYRVDMALYDTATSEHTMSKRKLHVAALRNDPLPEAWRGLPAVEFVNPSQPPDSFYLPSIAGRLDLKAATREPVQVNLVVNLTPSERLTGSSRAQSRNLAALLPAAKIFSQIDWGSAGFSLAMLDLSRRKVSYQQSSAGPLDWSAAGASLGEVNPGIIDVRSLGNRKLTAQFFVDEIEHRATTPHKQTVLIVLTNAVEFESGQEIHPLAIESTDNTRTFYIRYQSLFGRNPGGPPAVNRRPSGRGLPPLASGLPPLDQLAPLLKPLDPRVFEVSSPEQFRKALAAILAEISKL